MSNSTRQQCYSINGEVDELSYPCNFDGADAAQCCHANNVCMSNGLCYPNPEIDTNLLTPYFTFGCTDPDWTEDQCLDTCLRIPDGGDGIADCTAGYYCCYGLGGCTCDNKDSLSVFSLAITRAVATIPLSSDWLPVATSTSVAITSGGPSTTGTTLEPTLPVSSDASQPSATASSSTSAASGGSNTVALGAGLGVGLGVALIALVGAGVWFFARRKRRRGSPETDKLSASHPGTLDPHSAYSEMATPQEKGAFQPRQELGGRSVLDRTGTSPAELPIDHWTR